MICPLCYCETIVIRTDGTRRKRLCLGCHAELATIERMVHITEPRQYSFLGESRRGHNTKASVRDYQTSGGPSDSAPGTVTGNGAAADGAPGAGP